MKGIDRRSAYYSLEHSHQKQTRGAEQFGTSNLLMKSNPVRKARRNFFPFGSAGYHAKRGENGPGRIMILT